MKTKHIFEIIEMLLFQMEMLLSSENLRVKELCFQADSLNPWFRNSLVSSARCSLITALLECYSEVWIFSEMLFYRIHIRTDVGM